MIALATESRTLLYNAPLLLWATTAAALVLPVAFVGVLQMAAPASLLLGAVLLYVLVVATATVLLPVGWGAVGTLLALAVISALVGGCVALIQRLRGLLPLPMASVVPLGRCVGRVDVGEKVALLAAAQASGAPVPPTAVLSAGRNIAPRHVRQLRHLLGPGPWKVRSAFGHTEPNSHNVDDADAGRYLSVVCPAATTSQLRQTVDRMLRDLPTGSQPKVQQRILVQPYLPGERLVVATHLPDGRRDRWTVMREGSNASTLLDAALMQYWSHNTTTTHSNELPDVVLRTMALLATPQRVALEAEWIVPPAGKSTDQDPQLVQVRHARGLPSPQVALRDGLLGLADNVLDEATQCAVLERVSRALGCKPFQLARHDGALYIRLQELGRPGREAGATAVVGAQALARAQNCAAASTLWPASRPKRRATKTSSHWLHRSCCCR